MEDFILSNEERKRIFNVLSEHKKLQFNKIADLIDIRSNKLSYQLNLMVEKGFVVRVDEGSEGYMLSLEAQRLIPYFSQIFKKEVGVLPVVLGIVRKGSKILLIQRKKMPYKGYWGLFGGKQINGETIAQTIEREVFEESRLAARYVKTNGVVYERLREERVFKHSFLLIITTLAADSSIAMEQDEGKVAWFEYEDVVLGKVEKLIPSDVEFLRKYSVKEIEIEHIIMEEEEEKLTMG